MTYIQTEIDKHTALLTIRRPEALNALNSQVLSDLESALEGLDLDQVRAVILTGWGDKSFVAGADIGEMQSLSRAEALAFSQRGNRVFRRIETLPVPVIAAVNGYALGGGNELALSCDIRICAENAVFGQPETGLGITPGFGGTQRLARAIAPGYARQMLYTAKNIRAQEALRIGLVNAVYPQEELLPQAKKLAAAIAANGPIAVRACKEAVNRGLEAPMDQALAVEETLFSQCFETEDQAEGMRAFLSKETHAPYQNR